MFFRRIIARSLALASLLVVQGATAHAAWMWDQNNDKIDDRIVAVETQGLNAAHVGNTLAGKLRFAVMNAAAPFAYGVYVGYDHHPTDADATALAALGVPVQVRYRSIDYIRSVVSFAQAQQIANLPGVTRIETIPIFYKVNDVAARTLRARDSGNQLFPSAWKNLGVTGKGVVVAIFDTGVNDAPDGNDYPGHESLRGKFVGGGSFWAGQPELNTPLDQSVNPAHTIDPEATYHGTHVAGTAIGSGGPEGVLSGADPGFNAGLAPDARLVDCKVLSDAGAGFGSADAIDWLIYNRFNTWGLTGDDSIYRGVQVANLSLGGQDASDGTDANCAAVNAAHKAGIVMCVASGNDGNTAYMPSPAAADLALTVGSFTDDNTIDRADDYVADYSNEGPRMADADNDQLDEMKPNVMGSGTGINSALGDPITDGDRYHHINGTSMATPTIAGVAALVRSANKTLTADQVRLILMDTADHRRDRGQQLPSAADPFGLDPNYHPSWGWGQADAYAAVKEAQNAASTQVVRIQAIPQRGPDGVQLTWTTQREVGLRVWQLDRAPDVGGAPGAWTQIDEQGAFSPVTQIHRGPNRRVYSYTDLDGALDPAANYWYRVRWIDESQFSHSEPAIRVRIMDSPVVARLKYSWTHNYSDGDLYTRIGTGTNTLAPVWFRQGLGAQAADSVVDVGGVAFTGTLQHFFHVDLTADDMVDGFLPPSTANPWFLGVREGGFINTKGTVNDFSMTVFGPTTTTYTALNPPTTTVEKTETVFWIPLDPVTTLNHNPVLLPIGARTVGEGLTLSLLATATDPDDGQTITYSASGLPSGATFDPGTRQFAWTPGFSAAGSYTVRFRAFDNGFPTAAADSEDVTITVTERNPGDNLPPVMDPLTDRQGVARQRMQFRVTAHDPEGAAVTYSGLNVPIGASLDPATGIFDWTPHNDQIGVHAITFIATDPGTLTDSEQVYLVIAEPGQLPPPPFPCETNVITQNGIVDMGIDPISVAYSYQTFTVAPNTQRLEGTLSWFGGPTRDLDFTLLDSDSNVVGGSGSLANPEVITVGNLPAGTYIWRVTAFTNPDTCHYQITTEACIANVPLAVGDTRGPEFALSSAPNPFRALSAVSFALPSAGVTRLRIYDVGGRLVRTLQEGPLAAGRHVRVWNRATNDGAVAPAGVYFARLEINGRSLGRKLVLVK